MRRVGYAQGGPVGDQQTYVTGDDAAKQISDQYNSEIDQDRQERRGYAGGGSVPSDPEAKKAAGWGLYANEQEIISARQRARDQATANQQYSNLASRGPEFLNNVNQTLGLGYDTPGGGIKVGYGGYAEGGAVRQNFWQGGGAWDTQAQIQRQKARDQQQSHYMAAMGMDPYGNPIAGAGSGGGSGDTGYAEGGAVRQNFKRGGVAAPDNELQRQRIEAQNRMQAQVDAAEQARVNAMDPREQQIYAANNPNPDDTQGYMVERGHNAAMGSAGTVANDPGSMRALADISGVRAGYAEGGAVPEIWSKKVRLGSKKDAKGKKRKKTRIGYAEGGTVLDDPSSSPVQPDTQAAERAAAEELARQKIAQAEAEAQTRRAAEEQADRARQAADVQALQTRDHEPAAPAPQAPASAGPPAPDPSDVARQADDVQALQGRGPAPPPAAPQDPNAAPWYRKVYDSLVNRFQQDGAAAAEGRTDTQPPSGYEQKLQGLQAEGQRVRETGYNAPDYFDPRRDAAPPGGPALPERLTQPNPLAGDVQRINPYERINLEKYGLPGERFMNDMAETTKGSWIHRLLGGENAYSLDELNKIQATDPGRDIGGHLQKLHTEAELKGDLEAGQRVQQTVRNGYNAAVTVANEEFNRGNTDGALKAIEHGLNLFPNDRKYQLRPAPDGRIQVSETPEKPGMGEPKVSYTSPGQLRDLFNSNGGQFDHLMHNGVAGTLDILTGQAKPVDVPTREPERYRGTVTDGGFPTDSAAGLMERAEVAARRGASDPEATAYANKARAAVERGVPAAEVHGFLREGGDPYAQQGPQPPRPNVTRDEQGRLAYNPTYDIPGSTSPSVSRDVGGLPAVAQPDYGPGGRFIQRQAGSQEEHRQAGKAGSSSSSKSTSDVTYRDEPRPVQHPFTGYGYGERRAGYRAPVSAADAESPSFANEQRGQFNMPPAPPAGGAPRDVFETMRGVGRFDPSQAPQGTQGREDYNRQLQEQQQLVRPPTDTAYQARNRQLNQDSGYAAGQDRAAATQRQAIADSDAKYKTEQADYNRVRDKYGYWNQELAAQDKAGTAPAIRYTDDWRHVPRPPTDQEKAGDLAYGRQIGLQQEKNVAPVEAAKTRAAAARDIQTAKDTAAGERLTTTESGKGERLQTTEAGKDTRATEREQGRTLRANDIMAERRAHNQFLESKATQDLLQRRGTEDMKQSMTTFRTKLQQGIKPDPAEVENYNTLLQAVQQEQNQPAASQPAAPQPAAPQQGAAAGPVQIKSQDEYAKLPPNATYLDPNGILRRKT